MYLCVWPLTRPCANPTQLQSPLEGLSHRQQRKGGEGGVGGGVCGLISMPHCSGKDIVHRCDCASLVLLLNLFRPVS